MQRIATATAACWQKIRAARQPLAIWLILLLALALRLLLWGQPLHHPANDEVEYIAVARDLLAGRGWQYYEHYRWLRAPLYTLWLAGSLWLAGGDLHRAALPNIALSVANVYLTYRLAGRLLGRRAALLAGLIASVLLTFATFASLYMCETLFEFCFMAGLISLLRGTGDERRGSYTPGWLALAGLCFGLATLTRSITLLFLPMIAAWLLIRQIAAAQLRPGISAQFARALLAPARWLPGAIVLICAALTIAPWTIRNTLAYGRIIPVETGFSFNLWFFYEPHERNDQIYKTLEAIANPAERADYATAKGLARLREDPSILLRNAEKGWVALLKADTIEDRFIQESYYSDVDLPLFAAALIFDDALYFLIIVGATAGMALCYPRRAGQGRFAALGEPWWLLLAWSVYATATMLISHGEPRYRHFLYPVLIPYAAWMLLNLPQLKRTPRAALIGAGLLELLLIGTMLRVYPWGWAGSNLARGWQAFSGDIAWSIGDYASAQRAYERATRIAETPDGWLRRGDAARALGDIPEAIRAYHNAWDLAPPYIAASARLGDLLREQGRAKEAREAFEGAYADQQQVTDWAWRNLRPAPADTLDVGDGLDFGYIDGVYAAEHIAGEHARWSNGRTRIRLGAAAGAQRTALIQLRLAAPWPNSSGTRTQVCIARQCRPLEVTPDWKTYTILFRVSPDTAPIVDVQSDTFRPDANDPDSPDSRTLGVMISWARISYSADAAQP